MYTAHVFLFQINVLSQRIFLEQINRFLTPIPTHAERQVQVHSRRLRQDRLHHRAPAATAPRRHRRCLPREPERRLHRASPSSPRKLLLLRQRPRPLRPPLRQLHRRHSSNYNSLRARHRLRVDHRRARHRRRKPRRRGPQTQSIRVARDHQVHLIHRTLRTHNKVRPEYILLEAQCLVIHTTRTCTIVHIVSNIP